ncbi:MAG: ABC transporter permease [Lachnospiraceae bacterium]|nr:ABC transporter permease [Lachnospiraceae bacterium]
MIKTRRVRNLFMAPFAVWSILFIIVPLLLIAGYAFTAEEGGFTLANLAIMGRWEYRKALWLSVALALASTVLCLLIAYPLCLILAQWKLKKGSELILLFVLPLWMNSLLSTMAWQTILERNGLINQLMRLLGLPDLHLINTPFAIVLGMIYNFLPYMILPLYTVLSAISVHLREAAQDLGAGPWHTFLHVILPLSVPGIISGITLVFIPSLTTFVISAMLGGGKILLIGNIIEQEFTATYNWHLGSGLSMFLMIFIIFNMILSAVFERNE